MEKIRFKDFLIDYLEYNNISNKDFANRINVTQQHLIRILNGEVELSSKIIDKISLVTGISVDYINRIEFNFRFEENIEKDLESMGLDTSKYLNLFNYKFLIEKKWIEFVDKSNKFEIIKDILKFLRVVSPNGVLQIDSNAYYKSKNDKPELLILWLEKCRRKAIEQSVDKYTKDSVNNVVEFVLNEAMKNEFDEEKLISYFNKNGIFLVIQDDIPGSKIRGAFKVLLETPAIFLTHKHNRIADVYFALLHEIAHCKTDFNKAKSMGLVSYDDDKKNSEDSADKQAYNWMVDDNYYNNNILINNDYKLDDEIKFPKSFIVYRMAKDGVIEYSSKAYQNYNFLLLEK